MKQRVTLLSGVYARTRLGRTGYEMPRVTARARGGLHKYLWFARETCNYFYFFPSLFFAPRIEQLLATPSVVDCEFIVHNNNDNIRRGDGGGGEREREKIRRKQNTQKNDTWRRRRSEPSHHVSFAPIV